MRQLCCVALSILLLLGLTIHHPLEAASQLEEMVEPFTTSLFPSFYKTYSRRCLAQLHQQNYEAALSNCRQSLVLAPQQTEARLNLGLAHYHLAQHDDALAQFEQVLQLQPTDYRAYYNQGLVYTAQGKLEDSLTSYETALDCAPQQPEIQAEIYRDRGASYLMLARYDEAIADLNQAVKNNPSDSWSYFNRGCAHHRSHNLPLALTDFERVLRQDESNAQAHWNRGLVLASLGKTTDAIVSLQQAQHYFQIQQQLWAEQQIQRQLDQLQEQPPQIEHHISITVG